MAEHNALTDPQLHEPKGCAAASANEVYVSNGAGSGTWTATSSLSTSVVGQVYVLSGVIADVSTTETIYLPVPYAGTVKKVTTILEGAITIADATITPSNTTGAMETITVAFSDSDTGVIDTVSPSTNTTVAADSYVSIATDGGSTTAQRLWVSVTIERT